MTARGLLPCSACGQLWLGMRDSAKLAAAIRDTLKRAKVVAGADEVDFIRIHVGLACAELDGMCPSCGWNRVASERGAPPASRRIGLLSLVGDAPDAEEPIPAWMTRRFGYPPDWPKCHCGQPVLDGHLTCGRTECGTQADAERRR